MFDWLNAVRKVVAFRIAIMLISVASLSYRISVFPEDRLKQSCGGPHDVIVPAFQACMTLPLLP